MLDHLLHNECTVFRDTGFNQIDVLADINAIQHGLFPRILTDKVLVEVANRPGVRRGSQTDDKRIKIGQHLTPDVINRAVALVYDDAIKKFWWNFGIVHNFFRGFAFCRDILCKRCFFCLFVQFFPFEDGVHPLDRTDADLCIRRNVRAFQPVDVIQLREIPWVVIGLVCQEFTFCLLSKAACIHKKEDAVHSAVFQ